MAKKTVFYIKSSSCAVLIIAALSTPLHAQKPPEKAPQNLDQSEAPKKATVEKTTITFTGPPPLPRAKPEIKIWTPKEIEKADKLCSEVLSKWKIEAKQLPPLMDYEGCGDPAPLLVSQIIIDIGEQSVPIDISPAATLSCKMAGKIAHWLTHIVQPATKEYFNTHVSKIYNVSSYHCRKRYNANKGKMSEHAFANALDISAFSLADDTKITVLKNWEKKNPVVETTSPELERADQKSVKTISAALASPVTKNEAIKPPYKESAESVFLKKIHKGACAGFSTVLGPEANASHADHFHLDLGRNGRYQICE